MKTAIILHGMPSKEEYYDKTGKSQSNAHWLPWIQQQLIVNDIIAQTPEFPDSYEPNYDKWKEVFEQFTVTENTTLIGHSCGAGFLVRWLSENPVQVGKVILIAPWIDPTHENKNLVGNFFDFEIDVGMVEHTNGVTVFYSTDDDQEILDSVEAIKNSLPNAKITVFENKGHFVLRSMGTEEFPELLEEVLY